MTLNAGLHFVSQFKTVFMKRKNLLVVLFLAFVLPVLAQNADVSLVPYRKGNLWGYADPGKKIIITPAYEEADFFSEGFAAVKKGGKYGYINTAGKLVIPCRYTVAKPFRVGYLSKGAKIVTADDLDDNQKTILFAAASLRADGYEICINTKGESMQGCPAIPENSTSDLNKAPMTTTETNYSTVKKNDIFDRIVSDYKMLGREDNYYIAVKDSNYGVFNNKFEVIVPFEYSSITKLEISGLGYLIVEKNKMKGILFGNGSPYVSVDNSEIIHEKAKDGMDYFIITKDGKTGVKNSNYRDVVAAEYKTITYDKNGAFILTGNDDLKGLYFLSGQKIEPKYTEVRLLKGGQYAMLKATDGKRTVVSSNGNNFSED